MRNTINEILSNNTTRMFFLYAISCCLIGALIQWVGLPSIDHDELEAVRWGATKSWFVDKHPPLVGFISYWWAKCTNFNNLPFFLLSKIIAIVSLITIYALNRQFLTIHSSLVATAAYGSTYAYVTLMSQLDANGILHPIWPMFCLVLWKTLKTNKFSYWILLGLISSLAILGKYQSVLLLATALVLILSFKNFHKYLVEYKIYLSLFIFILILSPHLYTYYNSDYSLKSYIISRGAGENNFFSGRLSTIPFLVTQVLTWFLGYFILIFSMRKNLNFKVLKNNFNWNDSKTHFLFFMGFILPLSPIIVSLLFGLSLLGSWGLVSWFLFPTLILFLFDDNNSTVRLKPYLYFVPIYILIMFFVVIINNYYSIARPTPIPKAMQEIDIQWQKNTDSELNTVITYLRPAQGMSFYSKFKPIVIFGNPHQFTWVLDDNNCTLGPTLIITNETKIEQDRLSKIIKTVGTPNFSANVEVNPEKFKVTTTDNLSFKLIGYKKPICFQ